MEGRPEARLSSIVIDTNVWLDYYLGFRAGHRDAVELLDTANELGIAMLCAVTATKDLFYLIAAAQRADADLLVANDKELVSHSPVAALICEDALAYLKALRDVGE